MGEKEELIEVETLELVQVTLGLRPYTLIRLDEASDGSGEAVLLVDAGGGAKDQPLFMPLLALAEHAAEGNPVAEMLQKIWAKDTAARWGVEAVTTEFNEAWLPFVRGE